MIESLAALVVVAAAAAGLALRFARRMSRRGGGCTGCPMARPGTH